MCMRQRCPGAGQLAMLESVLILTTLLLRSALTHLHSRFNEAEAYKELGRLAAVACSKSQDRVLPVRTRRGIKHHRSLEAC